MQSPILITPKRESSPVHTPKRGSPNGKTRLLAFLRDLLDDVNQDVAVWTDKPNSIFKLVKPHRVAIMWGAETGNPSMTYDKMSRGLRYFYQNGTLRKIPGKDSRYQFVDTKAPAFNITNLLVPKKEDGNNSLSSSPTSSSSGSDSTSPPQLRLPLINPLALQESLRQNLAQFNTFMTQFPFLHTIPVQDQLTIFFSSKNTFPMLFPAP
ncbi:hypothetical protein B9Z55_016899 [Caenorhabditis nigoni]|uniref:ETS domain-containing protein n=1 Tax=Caenorhabditis nigoni TaxID=1611254 RepID=A0A2G5T778_9PELO|nr:hypothetical protein B9Z55_016899 [Caenorhabditis nigoni]